MDGEVQYVYKNMGYKLLTIKGQHYIIDVDRPLWIIFFPLVYWFFPHTVYKIDQYTLQQIETPKKQTKSGYFSFLGVGISILLANLLTPLVHYLDIETSATVNSIILFLFLAIVVF